MAAIEEQSAKSDSEKATVDNKAQETERAVSFVQNGSRLTKVRKRGRRYPRDFYVDTDSLKLAYSGSKKCSKKPSRIPLNQIVEIREGDYRRSRKQENLPKFTVVVGERMKTLTLIAPTAEIKDTWTCGLWSMVKEVSVKDPVKRERMRLEECFRKADKNYDGVLDSDMIVSLLKSMNMSAEEAEKVKIGALGHKITVNRFVAICKEWSGRQELDELFNNYASAKGKMQISDLSAFFKKEQGQEFTEDELKDFIGRSEQHPKLKSKSLLSRDGFSNLFFLPELNVKRMKCRSVYQDMTQPLSHYFINSSHNTYLEGHQLYGNSSSQQYDRVLTHRCRCVELDVWDGDDGEPVIYHGYTLTSKILFKNALNAINERAFKKSNYPIVVTLENHCSVEQQVRMAEHLKTIFGDKLLVEPLLEDSTALPSPEQLKGRVIARGKKLPAVTCTHEHERAESDADSDEAAEVDNEEIQECARKQRQEKGKVKLAQELSDCVAVYKVSFESFEQSASAGKWKFLNASSFKETKALDLIEKDGGRQYIQHNGYQLSRIYPAASRIDSSNYDPFPMWMAGCQVGIFYQ